MTDHLKTIRDQIEDLPPTHLREKALAALDALESENVNLKRDAEMHEALQAGDSVLLNEQAALLRECRAALDSLLQQKPTLGGLKCGSTTLGNLRASMYEYRPQGVFGEAK